MKRRRFESLLKFPGPLPLLNVYDGYNIDTPKYSVQGRGGAKAGGANFGINYGSISFGQLSGYIVFCIGLIGGASPPI